MPILDIKDIKASRTDNVRLKVNDKLIDIGIDRQKTGFGYKRFLLCPNCDERRTKLYIYGPADIYCRSCSPYGPYEGITHTTKGGTSSITYRMYRLAADYKIELEFPFSYYQTFNKKPKYMRWDKWNRGVKQLQILENMRFQTIFFDRKYDASLIKFILENHDRVNYNLCDIKENLYDWGAIARRLRYQEIQG